MPSVKQRVKERYFTKYTRAKGIFYGILVTYLSLAILASLLEPIIPNPPCPSPPPSPEYDHCEFSNPLYNDDPCVDERFARYLYITPRECDFARRVLFSAVMGAVIGWERRSADRPAGIRTMALVSLGSCLFTLCSTFAFRSSPMSWDSSRVSAAIPSGVGFLGAGLIFKETVGEFQTVHGLTTAASLWLSAATGIAGGGGLYFIATFSVGVLIFLLRFGPRLAEQEEEEEEEEQEKLELEEEKELESGGGGEAGREEVIAINGEITQRLPYPSEISQFQSTGRGRSGSVTRRRQQAQFVS